MIIHSLSKNVDVITTTRQEGNIALHTGENQESVLNRRVSLMKRLNQSIDQLTCSQVAHDYYFYEVKESDVGRGSQSHEDAIKGVDALYTRLNDIYLMMFHADCVPIAIYAPDQEIVAVIHSGWKGTSKNVIGHLIEHLRDNEYCRPELMKAYIGPSISMAHYPVSSNVVEALKSLPFKLDATVKAIDDNQYQVDLSKICKMQLEHVGVSDITMSDVCTYSNLDFYSYRRDQSFERNATLIVKRICQISY